MVALAAEEEIEHNAAAEPRRRWLRWLLTAVAAVAACVDRFLRRRPIPARSEQATTRELPVIENQEVLKEAGDIEFLRKLDKDGLFPEETGDAP